MGSTKFETGFCNWLETHYSVTHCRISCAWDNPTSELRYNIAVDFTAPTSAEADTLAAIMTFQTSQYTFKDRIHSGTDSLESKLIASQFMCRTALFNYCFEFSWSSFTVADPPSSALATSADGNSLVCTTTEETGWPENINYNNDNSVTTPGNPLVTFNSIWGGAKKKSADDDDDACSGAGCLLWLWITLGVLCCCCIVAIIIVLVISQQQSPHPPKNKAQPQPVAVVQQPPQAVAAAPAPAAAPVDAEAPKTDA